MEGCTADCIPSVELHVQVISYLTLWPLGILDSRSCAFKVSGRLRDQLSEKRKELADFQSKYKIRIRTEADVAAESQKAASETASKTQGVLA